MILIADSGSTKTDWCVALNGTPIQRIGTKGLNPFFQTEEDIQRELTATLLPQLPEGKLDAVYFYGAGCTPEKAPIIRRAIADSLPAIGNIKINSDMLAAAYSLCGHEAGIVCILGTGSNSCFYNGKEIVDNVSPLGFILGDEGSGAVLGKLLVGDILKNQLPPALKEVFLKQFNLTSPEIIDRVYRQPFPNRFLASLSPFLAQHIEEPAVHSLVLNSFLAFLRRNVMQYDYKHYPVHFIGSIAYYYKEVLQEAMQQMDLKLGRILQSPMEGLIQYHR
ncbi:ATPase [Bacteroides bouchesdurhonensis]|uniref:ATPase n=1 Tax=Bacteroides bouchesdurhonensis TaxID=1841855 RepID=UPI0011DD2103|nr:ATPase [Bacteroides bouchesdurhonensis]